MSSWETILLEETAPHVARITLNRPMYANALSLVLLAELQQCLRRLQQDRSVYAVIVTGAGEKAFCAGADLKERIHMTEEQVRGAVSMIRAMVNLFEELPQPVIAAINGAALGGGLELSLACDIRIASEAAVLGLTETSLAIIPGAGGTQRLPRLIGHGRARDLIYTARRVSAAEALQYGLVEYVVEAAKLQDQALHLAKRMTSNGPIALKMAKQAISRGVERPLAEGLQVEQEAYEETIHTKDRLEGLQAFRERRRPVYKGE